jgi:hypothetical protein
MGGQMLAGPTCELKPEAFLPHPDKHPNNLGQPGLNQGTAKSR